MEETECHKVFAFPTRREGLEMLKYARPDAAGRLFCDVIRCRTRGCGMWHMTTKMGPPINRRAREKGRRT